MDYLAMIQKSLENKYIAGVAILILVYSFARFILVRLVQNWSLKDNNVSKSWLKLAKRLPDLIILLGILFIWGQELRDFALSLVAVAAALVIATKEVILCFMGGLLRASTKLFEEGDRIEVAGLRGIVKEQTLVTTTLSELGPSDKSNLSTGRILKIPNSLFLSHATSVVPSVRNFILHVIRVSLPMNENWEEVEVMLKESANEIMTTYSSEMKESIKKNSKRLKDYPVEQEAIVSMEINAKDSIDFLVKLTVPYNELNKTENAVLRTFMKKYNKLQKTNLINE